MDELGGFEPTDTSGFIQIESIRIKKYVSVDHRRTFLTRFPNLDGLKPTFAKVRLAWSPRMFTAVVSKQTRNIHHQTKDVKQLNVTIFLTIQEHD